MQCFMQFLTFDLRKLVLLSLAPFTLNQNFQARKVVESSTISEAMTSFSKGE